MLNGRMGPEDVPAHRDVSTCVRELFCIILGAPLIAYCASKSVGLQHAVVHKVFVLPPTVVRDSSSFAHFKEQGLQAAL